MANKATSQAANSSAIAERRENVSEAESRQDLDVIRSVILGSNTTTIQQMQARLGSVEQRISDHTTRVSDTSEVLAEAVSTRLSADEDLGHALKPILVDQFRATSREEPEVMAEALFPILGPAVRKMIFNIISPEKKEIKQRGYQLEQLFVIHKLTGLPVCHVAAASAQTHDADMVSGMLNAIQSFVQEAFETNEFDSLDTLQVGELSVWIEWGPEGVLAAVVRGMPPKTLREALQILNEKVHAVHTDDLKNYSGDAAAFDPLRPELVQFLNSHDGSLRNRLRNLPGQAKKNLCVLAVITACMVLWFAFAYFDSYRWQKYVSKVDALPGIVITDHDRSFKGYRLFGLRDPLALDPRTLLAATSINPDKVRYQLEPYQATHVKFVLQRARSMLAPPDGVSLNLIDSVLYINGAIDLQWAMDAKKFARALVGVSNVVVNADSVDKLR